MGGAHGRARAQAGKLLVFDNGAVKMQLGEVLFDVTFGGASAVRQEATVLRGAQLLHLEEVPDHAVMAVDVDALLECAAKPAAALCQVVGLGQGQALLHLTKIACLPCCDGQAKVEQACVPAALLRCPASAAVPAALLRCPARAAVPAALLSCARSGRALRCSACACRAHHLRACLHAPAAGRHAAHGFARVHGCQTPGTGSACA